ncbi:baseplate J/gp47 family protein [Avibacterium paragallinarum]|uniref:Baseplate J protein n=1 Tax=Avibacterium paragallinarum TaxID=728 RepID=A0AAE5TI11_AVIPA|nr:baseplate J/gp47 family protein [Avibacterium paragallinarum]MEE3607577.1 baseplate J/gp47 family protein [Avibacterium paragallinarum]MEE3620047.1 baseplate J/gp47 family protein [Avibacterium paragallinarum]MEE3667731.1 baseplate J/gp47 family protein [Avibacterium paragallinarum]MEE3679959.1 baseplate J/gp47 family protein [Avibacterium paragallinarum]MEE4384864.1 baseplate J/gp47 family protein [Avibacterium paragallinarum]
MFVVPTLDEIRASILRDMQALDPQADVSVDSDNYARASSLAAVAEGIYAHQKWLIKQFFPDTADTEFLEKHAGLRGIRRRNATYASGRGATITGQENAEIPAGLQIKTEDNRFFETLESAVISSTGFVVVPVRSLATGAGQNIKTQTKGSFMAAPVGVQSEVMLNEVIGATDAESDASLLERLLELIRRPPAGGNKYDYRNWALSVDGVTAAYVYPLRRGLGTVDIAITADNDVPNEETIRRTQAYIDDVRPVTAKESKVVKPDVTKIHFDIQVKISGITLQEITSAIQAALADYFNTLIPGDSLIVSQCEAVVNNLVGVVDRKFITPTANRTADVTHKIEWFRLGNVNVSEMH